jgi:hypothetical protein
MATQRYGPLAITAAAANPVDGDGSTIVFECRDAGEIVVQITGGGMNATAQFEATNDLSTWFAVPGTPLAGGADVTSATAAGRWRFNSGGLVKFRVRCSAWVATYSVTAGLTPGVFGQQGASISAAVTGSVDIVTSMVPGGGATHLGKAEDAAHTSGDTGVAVWAVQKATPADVSSDGDYAPLQVSGGYLYVHPKNILNEDVTVGAAQPLAMVGAMRAHTPANTSGTDLDAEPLQIENGLLWTGNKTLATSYGVTSAVFSSADATTAAAVTDAPTATQKIVIDDVIISSITATNFRIECETSAVGVLQVFTTTTAPGVIVLKGLGIKLATADKKAMIKAANAGQVYCTVTYHSEA